ncbi:hypothetical protein GCM10027566_22020 [Arachidicoccus ginsenosidivorans]
MDRMEQLQQMLKENAKDSFLRHALAMELQRIGEDKRAIQTLQDLLADDPAYVGSYYQLGKLLEKTGDSQTAIQWYEKGMEQAKEAGEKRAYNELQSALDELIYE